MTTNIRKCPGGTAGVANRHTCCSSQLGADRKRISHHFFGLVLTKVEAFHTLQAWFRSWTNSGVMLRKRSCASKEAHLGQILGVVINIRIDGLQPELQALAGCSSKRGALPYCLSSPLKMKPERLP